MFGTKTIRAPSEGEALTSREKTTRCKSVLSLTFFLLSLSFYMIILSFNTIWWCIRRPLQTVSDSPSLQVLLAPFLVCGQKKSHDWLCTNEIQVSNFPRTSLVPLEYFHPIEVVPMYDSLFHIQMAVAGWGENIHKRFFEGLCWATWWRTSGQDSHAIVHHSGIPICVSVGGLLSALK